MKTPFEQHELDEMKNNPNNYKWGIFYFNPKDYRVIVPKRNVGMGWTLNFANLYAYLIILGIIAFAIIIGKLGGKV
ncbi:MAG: DUF5808 domain-containing protein [Bacteroidota bacterium]